MACFQWSGGYGHILIAANSRLCALNRGKKPTDDLLGRPLFRSEWKLAFVISELAVGASACRVFVISLALLIFRSIENHAGKFFGIDLSKNPR
jgi:hypothetical protein